jgi:dihydrofolate synthase/folylpolyglutamate synthase
MHSCSFVFIRGFKQGCAMSATWVYSPDPDAETAIAGVARDYPQMVPAGLQRFRDYLGALGDPHLKIPPVLHVAGTNGKGSVLAFLQAAFEAGGQSVHKFTSPHLVRFEERIVVNGKMIGGALLPELMEECRRASAGHTVSFFEFFMALAFLAFSRALADVTLLETGLGGLLDATNVVEKNIAILTRVSFDHTHVLGKTLPAIAAQKAGIIKRGCPAVLAPQPGDGVTEVFERRVAEMDAPLLRAGKAWDVKEDAGGFSYTSARHEFHLPLPALAGAHQILNAGAAIAALEAGGYEDLLRDDLL